MSDNVIGCIAVAFRFCRSPGPLQFLLGIVGWLREGENEPGPEDQTSANRRDQPLHSASPLMTETKIAPYCIFLEELQQLLRLGRRASRND
jgi:hypothetical protein